MSSYLWQNFLTDEPTRQYIYDQLFDIQAKFDLQNCIEIGPWKGSLTLQLLQIYKSIRLIEKDELMKSHVNKIIKANSNVNMLLDMCDVLDRSDNTWFEKSKTLIYGSLPYYITSPIIDKFMLGMKYDHSMFIVQLEFGQRVETGAGKKSYFWRLLNNFFTIYISRIIWPNCFTPPPKVGSCLLCFDRKDKTELNDDEYIAMVQILDKISGFKRKTLGKIAKMTDVKFPKEIESKRLEEVTWEEMKWVVSINK
jgi:16S rRNA (adenine1518-N6/adenine1519-N6)-dimethyltransferase